jgi:metal-responsive CopG/Arc/MetJ family transcriptional regulator
MTPTRRNTTVRLEDELYRGMEEIWRRDGVQPSEQIRRALRAYLEAKGVTFKKAARPRADTRKSGGGAR